MKRTKVEAFSVLLKDWRYIVALAEKDFHGDKSKALRKIIADHRNQKEGWRKWQIFKKK